GNLCSAAPCLREADRDRLLATRDLLAGPSRSQRPAFAFAHGALDLLRRLASVLPMATFSCHQLSLVMSRSMELGTQLSSHDPKPTTHRNWFSREQGQRQDCADSAVSRRAAL